MKDDHLLVIIKQARTLTDRKLARNLRVSVLESLQKTAEEYEGILQHFDSNVNAYPTRQHYSSQRGGKLEDKLYGVGLPEHQDTDLSVKKVDRSLSTRYSPDHVGVQARRISDGVYQDPITNKVYDWNEGFKTEDGDVFSGGGISLQTDIYNG